MSDVTDRLRIIAGNASPGPWVYDAAEVVADGAEGRPWYVVEVHDNGESGVQSDDDGCHIATFDPVLVGAMLDVIEAAEHASRAWTTRTFLRSMDRLDDALARFREVAG